MSQRGAIDTQNKPGRSAMTANALRFVDDGSGGLVLSTDGEPAVRLVDDGEGGQVLDDAATSGTTIVATPIAIY